MNPFTKRTHPSRALSFWMSPFRNFECSGYFLPGPCLFQRWAQSQEPSGENLKGEDYVYYLWEINPKSGKSSNPALAQARDCAEVMRLLGTYPVDSFFMVDRVLRPKEERASRGNEQQNQGSDMRILEKNEDIPAPGPIIGETLASNLVTSHALTDEGSRNTEAVLLEQAPIPVLSDGSRHPLSHPAPSTVETALSAISIHTGVPSKADADTGSGEYTKIATSFARAINYAPAELLVARNQATSDFALRHDSDTHRTDNGPSLVCEVILLLPTGCGYTVFSEKTFHAVPTIQQIRQWASDLFAKEARNDRNFSVGDISAWREGKWVAFEDWASKEAANPSSREIGVGLQIKPSESAYIPVIGKLATVSEPERLERVLLEQAARPTVPFTPSAPIGIAPERHISPGKPTGRYGLADDDIIANSRPITPSTRSESSGTLGLGENYHFVESRPISPLPPATPRSTAYLTALSSAPGNTAASTRLLAILRAEGIDLESSLGLKLLDLASALRRDGELAPVQAPAYSVESKLDDVAGMLNAIAEAVGVQLVEVKDGISVGPEADPDTSYEGVTAVHVISLDDRQADGKRKGKEVPTIRDLADGRDRVAQAVFKEDAIEYSPPNSPTAARLRDVFDESKRLVDKLETPSTAGSESASSFVCSPRSSPSAAHLRRSLDSQKVPTEDHQRLRDLVTSPTRSTESNIPRTVESPTEPSSSSAPTIELPLQRVPPIPESSNYGWGDYRPLPFGPPLPLFPWVAPPAFESPGPANPSMEFIPATHIRPTSEYPPQPLPPNPCFWPPMSRVPQHPPATPRYPQYPHHYHPPPFPHPQKPAFPSNWAYSQPGKTSMELF
ncbi:hypothetical protein P7C73_g562, partial [Tremellales sp. Uapishka_1]